MYRLITFVLVFAVLGFPMKSQSQDTPTTHTAAEITSIPPELSDHPGFTLNINIGNQVFGTPGSGGKDKAKVETSNAHVLAITRKGDFLWLLIESGAGVQYKKIDLDGLKFEGNQEVAWSYHEFDVYEFGKITGKEHLLVVHKNYLDGVLNLPEAARLP